MMMSPKIYYEYELKGKSQRELVVIIRKIEHEIKSLKEIVEFPDYVSEMDPSEEVQLSVLKEYLEMAKIALCEAMN